MENYHNRKILLSRGFRKRQKISDIKDHKEKVKKKER